MITGWDRRLDGDLYAKEIVAKDGVKLICQLLRLGFPDCDCGEENADRNEALFVSLHSFPRAKLHYYSIPSRTSAGHTLSHFPHT